MTKDQTVGDRVDKIFQETKRIGISALPTVLGYLAVMITASVLIDIGVLSDSLLLVLNILGVAVIYLLIKAMIGESGIAPDGLNAGFGTYFGLALLSGIAIGLGLLLLIIPGLILLVRWSAIYGYGLVDGVGVSDAMTASWEATSDHFWPIAIASLIPIALTTVGLGVLFSAGMAMESELIETPDASATLSLPVALAANSAIYLSSAVSSAIGLAVFSLLRYSDDNMLDVFE